ILPAIPDSCEREQLTFVDLKTVRLLGFPRSHPFVEPVRRNQAPARFQRIAERGLITKGQGHVLRTAPTVDTPNVLDLPHEMAGERYALLRYGGRGAASTLIC